MKGYFMKKNEELVLMIGTVKQMEDSGSKYGVTIEYDYYDASVSKEGKKDMVVFFQNQKPAEGNDKAPIMWADIARNMNMRVGSVIAVLARPNKDGTKADGYVCRYNGVITFAPDEEHMRARNAVGGLVTWLHDKVDANGKPYVSMGVSIGRSKDGSWNTATVKTNNEKLMSRCKKALTPREDGTMKYAWFNCGEVYTALNGEGEEFAIYTAFDFTITGSRQKQK